MAEQYNSAFYGAEIDAAVAKAKSMLAYNAQITVDTAVQYAGQLLFVGDDGKITALKLGNGLYIENGVLNVITGTTALKAICGEATCGTVICGDV